MAWFPASNKVLYVGSCIMDTINGMVLYEKVSRVKTMKIVSLYVLIRMMVYLIVFSVSRYQEKGKGAI